MALEVQLKAANLKFQGAETRAKEAEEKAIVVEAVARVAKAEMVRAIEEYKRLADFEDKVSEATCDAFQKRFAECKRKVTNALPKLDLRSIVTVEPEP